MFETICATLLFLSDGQCPGGVCSAPPRRVAAVAVATVAAPVVRAGARAVRAVHVQRFTPRGVFFRLRLR